MTNIRTPGHRDTRPDWFAKMRDCDGKQQLLEQEARARVNSIKRREKRSEVEAYLCRHCQCWHVGHVRKS